MADQEEKNNSSISTFQWVQIFFWAIAVVVAIPAAVWAIAQAYDWVRERRALNNHVFGLVADFNLIMEDNVIRYHYYYLFRYKHQTLESVKRINNYNFQPIKPI